MRDRIAAAVDRGGHGQGVEIIAVTKTHGSDAVLAAWACGIRAVGENKVQEALGKMEEVSVAVEWHLIGHLQRNKAKHAARFALIHSVDSPRLADALHEVGDGRGGDFGSSRRSTSRARGAKGGIRSRRCGRMRGDCCSWKGSKSPG